MDQPVLRARDVLHRQFNFSFDARRTPQQKMRCALTKLMPAVTVAHRQGVGERDRAGRRAKRGLRHHRPVQVAASHLCGSHGPHRPVAGVFTEEAAEDRGAVEAREAQPVDRSVPTHEGGAAPSDAALARVIGRASVVLLSSHFERYVYSVNEEAAGVLNATPHTSSRLPELLRLLHSRSAIDELVATGWERRAEGLQHLIVTDAWLWTDDLPSGSIDHRRLIVWMKAPTPPNLIRYYRHWDVADIFTAITRATHTRTDLWLKIDELVRKRNNIAHGDLATEATRVDLRGYETAALRFCERADRQLAAALASILETSAPW